VTSKREREIARAKYERQQIRRNTKQARNRLIRRISAAVSVLAVLGFVVYNQTKPASNSAASATQSPNADSSAAPISTNAPIDGCQKPASPRANNIVFGSKPKDIPSITNLTISTNCGDLVIAANPAAPNTSGTIGWLAQKSFFDNTSCHRLTTQGIFVLQCGDPSGRGTGSPGFSFADENLPKAGSATTYVYPRGTVAMANSGPNTNGSQFFLVYKDSPLPPNYSVWGTITSGLNWLDKVAAAGVSGGGTDGLPNQAVVISKVTTTP
jgi:peptidyl-prolyl cis-trans isomerase B (cyclophilin B)